MLLNQLLANLVECSKLCSRLPTGWSFQPITELRWWHNKI